jgi:hypothetical protein
VIVTFPSYLREPLARCGDCTASQPPPNRAEGDPWPGFPTCFAASW